MGSMKTYIEGYEGGPGLVYFVWRESHDAMIVSLYMWHNKILSGRNRECYIGEGHLYAS